MEISKRCLSKVLNEELNHLIEYSTLHNVHQKLNLTIVLKHNKLTCPKCNSKNTLETVRFEICDDCGFFQDYHNWNHNEPDFL